MRRTIGRPVCCISIALFAVQAQNVEIQTRSGKPPLSKPAGPAPSTNLRVDSNLVMVPITVTDKFGRPVTGLEKENFRVLDDKVEQAIAAFAMDDEPVAIGFIFDVSGSIGSWLSQYRLAAREFFKAADEKDEFFLVTFESAPKLLVPLTQNVGKIEYEIMMTRSKGSTALFDAVYMAANEVRKSKLTKKALILVSDGGENNSRYTYTELRNALRETNALLYSVGPSPDASYGDADGRLLKNLAEMTGGRLIEVDRVGLPELAQKIIVDLRNRYLIGYSPKEVTRDGRFHHIGIQIVQPRGLGKLTAHWRTGYYAPDN